MMHLPHLLTVEAVINKIGQHPVMLETLPDDIRQLFINNRMAESASKEGRKPSSMCGGANPLAISDATSANRGGRVWVSPSRAVTTRPVTVGQWKRHNSFNNLESKFSSISSKNKSKVVRNKRLQRRTSNPINFMATTTNENQNINIGYEDNEKTNQKHRSITQPEDVCGSTTNTLSLMQYKLKVHRNEINFPDRLPHRKQQKEHTRTKRNTIVGVETMQGNMDRNKRNRQSHLMSTTTEKSQQKGKQSVEIRKQVKKGIPEQVAKIVQDENRKIKLKTIQIDSNQMLEQTNKLLRSRDHTARLATMPTCLTNLKRKVNYYKFRRADTEEPYGQLIEPKVNLIRLVEKERQWGLTRKYSQTLGREFVSRPKDTSPSRAPRPIKFDEDVKGWQVSPGIHLAQQY